MADEQSISRVFNGVTLTGTYALQDGIVTLRTAFGNKTAQLLGSNLATLAGIMLRELYEDIASRGVFTGALSIAAPRPHLFGGRFTKLAQVFGWASMGRSSRYARRD
jgi:hypothetical protein